MKIVAFITEAVAISKMLNHLGEPTSPPRLLPARGPPLWEIQGQILAKATPAGAADAGLRVRSARRVVGQGELSFVAGQLVPTVT